MSNVAAIGAVLAAYVGLTRTYEFSAMTYWTNVVEGPQSDEARYRQAVFSALQETKVDINGEWVLEFLNGVCVLGLCKVEHIHHEGGHKRRTHEAVSRRGRGADG